MVAKPPPYMLMMRQKQAANSATLPLLPASGTSA